MATPSVPAPIPTLKMSPQGADTFKKAVKYILTEWPSLTLAMENGMGGAQAEQKQAWMCEHIAEMYLKNKDIDLEDYLAEMVNQEFDTIVEDGSLEYNVKWIEKFYKDCLQGKDQEVVNSINQAAAKKQSLGSMRIPAPVCQTQDSSDDDDDEDDGSGDAMGE